MCDIQSVLVHVLAQELDVLNEVEVSGTLWIGIGKKRRPSMLYP